MQKQAVYVQKLDNSKMEKLPIINRVDGKRKYSEKEEKFLREMCTYEFTNLEQQGYPHSFTYQGQKFEFLHGGRYKIPRFIADHVESASIPIWEWVPDGSGHMIKEMKGTKRRFQMREIREF